MPSSPSSRRCAVAGVAEGHRVVLGIREALHLSLPAFVCGKLVTIVVVGGAAWAHGAASGIPGWHQLSGALANWDGQNYLAIAQGGYPANTDPGPGAPAHVWAFLPGYPILIAGAGLVLRDLVLSGIVVSAACELVALAVVGRLVAAERDMAAARTATWLLALAPYALFLSAVYTESAFIAAAGAALMLSRQGRPGAAAVAGAAATAVRVTGLALIPALVVEEICRRRRLTPRLLWPALITLPLVSFSLYSWLHAGDALAFSHIQSSPSFHRSLSSPITGLRATWEAATSPTTAQSSTFVFVVELVCGVVGLGLCAALVLNRAVPRSFTVYACLVWLLAVAQPYWLSVGRYELGMLPVLLLAVDALRRRPQLRTATLGASAGLMALLASVFASGGFAG